MQEKTRERPFSDPYSIKARALIYAHLNRMDLPANTLQKDKNLVISKCPFLINEMINTDINLIAAVNANYVPKCKFLLFHSNKYLYYLKTDLKCHVLAHCPKLESIENLMRLSSMIVQALGSKTKNNMLQLPHIDESHLRYFFTKKVCLFYFYLSFTYLVKLVNF